MENNTILGYLQQILKRFITSKMDSRLYLLSNESTECFPDNSLTVFRNALPREIASKQELNCKIAVETFSFQPNFLNMPAWLKQCNHHFILFSKTESGGTLDYFGRLEETNYSKESFIKTLNDLFPDNGFDFVMFRYREDKLEVKGNDSVLLINAMLAEWLCFSLDNIQRHTINYNDEGVLLTDNYQAFAFETKPFQLPSEGWKRNNNLSFLQPRIPSRITIVMNELSRCVGPSIGYKTLAVIPFSGVTDEPFYYEVAQKEWMDIDMINVSSLSIQLLDENYEKLNLGFGQPTFLRLRIMKMPSNSFTIRVSSLDIQAVGENTDFRLLLPEPLHLEDERWQVALASVHFPLDFERVTNDESVIHMISFRDNRKVNYSFAQRDFNSSKALINALNRKLETVRRKKGTAGRGAAVSLDEDGRLQFEFHQTMSIAFSHNFANILGLTDLANPDSSHEGINIAALDLVVEEGRESELSLNLGSVVPVLNGTAYTVYYGSKPLNLDRLKPTIMMLYCDIIQPVMIGVKHANLLKIIPVKKRSHTKGSFYECRRLDFERLNTNHVPSIQFQLRRSDGEPIRFYTNNAEVLYTLIFRKK